MMRVGQRDNAVFLCPITLESSFALSGISFQDHSDYLSVNVSALCSGRNHHVAKQQSIFADKTKKLITVKEDPSLYFTS